MSKRHTRRTNGNQSHTGVLSAGVALVGLFVWSTLTASASLHELLLGACAMTFTLALLLKLLRTEVLQFRFHLRDLLLIRQLPTAILKDCWILTVVLCRDLAGKQQAGSFYRACGFKTSGHDPLLIERSALATVYTTASPNMLIIGIDPAQSLMLFHQLQRAAVPAYTQALGAAGQHATPSPRTAGSAS